jgi:DNA-binding transcriptional MerR regulator
MITGHRLTLPLGQATASEEPGARLARGGRQAAHVELLPIGAFSRASRLSLKALRIYDELGLLPPAHVDPASGYRFYDPVQLERARLVAWLRRLDMPLARIREVCELAPAEAAEAVRALVDDGRLSAEEAMTHPQRALLLRALDGSAAFAPDLRLHDAQLGDRYLLCSDGLSAVVPEAELHRVVSTVGDPAGAVRELVALANRTGGPDNVSCVVADVVEPA